MAIIKTIMARRRRPYTLVYPPALNEHLRTIDAKYHRLVREKLEEQLLFEPAIETRNRKPLRQPAAFSAQWEIRLGPDNRFRVLYEVDEVGHQVHVLAIGEKQRGRLLVAGEDVGI